MIMKTVAVLPLFLWETRLRDRVISSLLWHTAAKLTLETDQHWFQFEMEMAIYVPEINNMA